MNSKATKQPIIDQPPLLNMSSNRPWVDSSFRNWEKINAPFMNEMISPVYVNDTKDKLIYDTDGHAYKIDEEGYLTRDGVQLFEVRNKKFVREDVTERFNQYHDYDMTDDYEAWTLWNPADKSFILHFGNNDLSTGQIYEEGVIVASRLRIIGNKAYFAIYYDVSDSGYLSLFVMDLEGHANSHDLKVRWYRQQIRRNVNTAIAYQEYTVENASPIINIAKVAQDGLIAISMVSSYGRAINSTRNYFATYFLTPNDDIYQIGVDASPTSETSSVTVTNTYSAYFRANKGQKITTIYSSCITADNGETWYKYEEAGVKGEEITFPVTYQPDDTGNTIEIDGVTYNIYDYTGDQYELWMNLYGNISSGDTNWSGTITYNGTDYTGSYTPGDDHLTIVIPTFIVYRGETAITDIDACKVTWMSEDTAIPSNTWNLRSVNTERTSTSTVNAGWLVSPNVVIDDGTFYAFWNINLAYSEANNWNSQYLTNGSIIEESGIIDSYSVANDSLTYTISPIDYVQVTSNYNVARSNSFIANQNIAIDTVKLNNTAATSSWTLYNSGGVAGSESASSKFLEYSNSNTADLRYYPGTYRDSTFNYFGDQKFSGDTVVGNVEDQPIFVVQGYRTPVHSADRFLLGNTAVPFNILYNTDAANTCVPQGISYSESPNSMGTLLTPWQSLDDDFYISANHTSVVYRDKSNRYYKISIENGNELAALLDDRYILINTTSYWNMYDSVQLKKFHYATDYNDRVMFGQTAVPDTVLAGANAAGSLTYSRVVATAINAAYNQMPRYAVSSLLLPKKTLIRVTINAERPFNCVVAESSDTQPIDIYYGAIGSAVADYKYSLFPYNLYDRAIRFDLIDSSYSVASGTNYYSPNIFTQYIQGAGNDDMIKETYSTFKLQYYDQVPFFLYNSKSEVSSKNGDDIYFFVLQGQFYAFMNEKIYSMIYSNGSISQQDAIIDARGMKFIGSNPMIAFFWSPRNRAIYSFTGDANLEHIYNANKFTTLGYDSDGNVRHWYDETTQSIFADTDRGLLVFGPKNTYLFENFIDVTNCQFSKDSVSHITSNGITYNLVYYPTEDYEALELDGETSFYGIGANEVTSIDRWDITLFDYSGTKPVSEITVGVRSLTDITVKSEEKTLKITPDMWDNWSNSCLIRYVPKLIKGQGLRLYIKTPLAVQKIIPHIADQGTGTLTRRGI